MNANRCVEFGGEIVATLPRHEARAMHSGVRETPQRVIRVCDEVRCADNVIALRENGLADRASCLATEDQCHAITSKIESSKEGFYDTALIEASDA